jgi:hypothetical protein
MPPIHVQSNRHPWRRLQGAICAFSSSSNWELYGLLLDPEPAEFKC